MIDGVSCSNPDCQVAENGSCLQGHDPVDSCPNFGTHSSPEKIEKKIASEQDSLENPTETQERLKLPTGQPFSQRDIDAFLLQKPGRLVAIVGDTSCGKTTLLCSIYDRFLRGAFAKRTFAGSATLTAFEQIAHRSRAVSGAMAPDTERTFLSQGLQFYHLATASESQPGTAIHLFVSDRAGESYRSGMDRPDELASLSELQLARVIVLLVDGARLVLPEEKHEVLDSVRALVRSLVDSGTASETQHLQIVLTKRDEVERSGHATELIKEVQEVVERLQRAFGASFASISFLETSARDPKMDYQPAHGCGELFQTWINVVDPKPRTVPPSLKLEKHFDRLAHNLIHGVKE